MSTRVTRKPLVAARRAAHELVDALAIDTPEEIDVEAIAWVAGARVVDGGLDGAQARLLQGARAIIRLSSAVAHPGARRFSVAHELGHLVLQHPAASIKELCSAASVQGILKRGIEAEANAFASELLVPERLLLARHAIHHATLERIDWIAQDFNVSTTAAALRLVELTTDMCALVFSTAGRVVWAARSRTFPVRIPRGRALHPDSRAARCERGEFAPPRMLPARAWLDAAEEGSWVTDEALWMPEREAALSLLRWAPKGDA